MGTEDIVERRARVSCAGGTVLHPAVKGVRTEDGQFSLRVTGERFRGMRRDRGGTGRMEPKATFGALSRETLGESSVRE